MNQNEGQGELQYSGGVQPPAQTPTSPNPQPLQQEVAKTPDSTVQDDKSVVQWKASEFVDHQKNASWFFLLALGAVVLCAIIYLLTRSFLSMTVVGVAILAFGTVANQRPRTLQYTLMPTTLRVGDKSYSYDDFRSFSVVQDGALWSVVLQPNKRFMPALTIYFAPDDGEKIFDALAEHLPHEERQLDSVDKLMRKIRF